MKPIYLKRRTLIGGGLATLGGGAFAAAREPWSSWRPGLLDIHHISTGRGNATFVITPGGATLLIDAGELDPANFDRFAPLELGLERPRAGAGAGRTIARYIARHAPAEAPPHIDQAVLTHYHDDHIGAPHARAPKARDGDYRLSGVSAVAAAVPIKRLLDRGDEGGVADAGGDAAYANYLAFTQAAARRGVARETLTAGREIVRETAQGGTTFSARAVKVGRWIWTGRGQNAEPLVSAEELRRAGRSAENALSIALVLRYGRFSYFSGGDNSGLGSPEHASWQDVETPLAAVVGPVEAMTLDHHGNRDANNGALINTLRPRLVVQQCWTSDQPGQEVVQRLARLKPAPLVLATQIFPSTLAAIGPPMRKLFKPRTGHVVIRARPDGTYDVFVLDDRSDQPKIVWRATQAA